MASALDPDRRPGEGRPLVVPVHVRGAENREIIARALGVPDEWLDEYVRVALSKIPRRPPR